MKLAITYNSYLPSFFEAFFYTPQNFNQTIIELQVSI